jgi:hypothetical protein
MNMEVTGSSETLLIFYQIRQHIPENSNPYIHGGGGGHAVAELVEALCYKPEGRGFDSR